MWLLPISIIVFTILIAVPLSRYMAKIMDGKYRAPGVLRWFEKRLDSGPQNWKQYTVALLVFNTVLFVYGYVVLSLQPRMPLNPRGLGMLAPSTIFNTVISFITNTNIQHYSGDVAFSNFSQIFFCIANFFLSASVGLCALAAIIRALRGDLALGNFFVDMWRVVVYMFLPAAFVISLVFLAQGMPMTYQSDYQVATLEPAAMGTTDNGQPKQQTIVVGPLAAFVPMKMMGTNGGGFLRHELGASVRESQRGHELLRNFLHDAVSDGAGADVRPDAQAAAPRDRHILGDAPVDVIGTVVWAIYFDTLKPNPGLTAHPQSRIFEIASATAPGGKRVITLPPVAGLPVDQHLGNLEGKELRFGTSAGATFAAATVDVTCGAVNCEHDSLNPIAGLSPFVGMWLNCIYGGKGVGMINLLLFLIIGIFLAGQMVGRTPEYLGRKIGGREMTLAMIALLVHPFLILEPSGLFAATNWGIKAENNPGRARTCRKSFTSSRHRRLTTAPLLTVWV